MVRAARALRAGSTDSKTDALANRNVSVHRLHPTITTIASLSAGNAPSCGANIGLHQAHSFALAQMHQDKNDGAVIFECL